MDPFGKEPHDYNEGRFTTVGTHTYQTLMCSLDHQNNSEIVLALLVYLKRYHHHCATTFPVYNFLETHASCRSGQDQKRSVNVKHGSLLGHSAFKSYMRELLQTSPLAVIPFPRPCLSGANEC